MCIRGSRTRRGAGWWRGGGIVAWWGQCRRVWNWRADRASSVYRSGSHLIKSKDIRLEEAHNEVELEHADRLRKAKAEAKTSEEHIVSERYNALSRYHGVLQSFWGIAKAANDRNACYTDTLTQVWILFEDGRNVKKITLSTGSTLDVLWVIELKTALEVNDLKLHTIPGLAAEHSTYYTEDSRLRDFIKTHGRETSKTVMVIQYVQER